MLLSSSSLAPLKLARVETYNYPDVPRYFFPAAVVTEQPDYLTLYLPMGAPVCNGKVQKLMHSNNHSLALLYPERDYNLVIFWSGDWQFHDYYINIALPSKWDGELCSYVDLDLDVQWRTEKSDGVLNGTREAGVFLLDRDEYEVRKLMYNYPPDVMARAEAAVPAVLAHIESRAFPFDDSLLDWRPTPEMLALGDLPDSAALWHFGEGLRTED